MRKTIFTLLAVSLLTLGSTPAMAHTPLCSCWDNGDGTATCEGGFSDGSSASGVGMFVLDRDGNVLLKGKMSELSEFNFKIPKGDYTVKFDAGEGHRIEIKGKEIY